MAAMAEMAVKAEKAEKAMSDDLRDSSESFVEICSRKGIETHERHRQENIYICIHAYIRTYIHACIHAYKHTCMHMCITYVSSAIIPLHATPKTEPYILSLRHLNIFYISMKYLYI